MSYYAKAVERAKSRIGSPWHLLMIPPFILSWVLLGWGFATLFQLLHASLYPTQYLRHTPTGLGPTLAGIGGVVASFTLSLLIANCVVWLVPPARRALDREAKPVPSADFSSAQRQLLRASKFVVPIGLGLALLGALLPWYR